MLGHRYLFAGNVARVPSPLLLLLLKWLFLMLLLLLLLLPPSPTLDSIDVEDTIEALHSKEKYAVCYISIGTWEPWRADKDDFPEEALEMKVANWPNEQWINIGYTGKGPEVRNIRAAWLGWS